MLKWLDHVNSILIIFNNYNHILNAENSLQRLVIGGVDLIEWSKEWKWEWLLIANPVYPALEPFVFLFLSV